MSSYEELANLWQGIATGGCEKHFNANPEDYPPECIICLRAALTQAQAERDAWPKAISRALDAHEGSSWEPSEAEEMLREIIKTARTRSALLDKVCLQKSALLEAIEPFAETGRKFTTEYVEDGTAIGTTMQNFQRAARVYEQVKQEEKI